MPSISIIIPVLNEAPGLAATLQPLQPLRQQDCELVVVDGGSHDTSAEQAEPLADRVLTAPRGRAVQMNAGAAAAGGDILWFLHSDSQPPEKGNQLILHGLQQSNQQWGRFDVRLSGNQALLRVVEALMNWRSRLTGIATGDQGIFVARTTFQRIGGYPDIPLMEDIALSRMLKRIGPPLCLRQPIRTSSRRWERNGIIRTVLLMWGLRLAYFLGVAPARLARIYQRS